MAKLVYAYVVADLLHIGHVLALENAKALAGEDGRLIVGVLTDEAAMEKKPKPVLSFSERMRLIKSLKCVDVVVPQKTYSPLTNVKLMKPDVLMESESHSDKELIETHKLAEVLGFKVIVTPYYPGQSSTTLKKKIKEEN
ncbi:MAG: adenylyltransferase/cytidyltransferase family protein [Candidatus Woesearchaeota archaeon]